MTFTRDNIVGVEFTSPKGIKYKIDGVNGVGSPIISWQTSQGTHEMVGYTMQRVLHFLNNGTWIVKNSKV